jgi:DNA-binding beta-propeller fold protein YncE
MLRGKHIGGMTALTLVAGTLQFGIAGADDDVNFLRKDFGTNVEKLLEIMTPALFGFGKPLDASAPPTTGAYRTASQGALDQVLVAKGLKVEYLTRSAANNTDMLAFWPAANPTHIITCVEDFNLPAAIGTYPSGLPKFQPSVQRINLKNGQVDTILRGLSACDGIRTTPWGTVVVTEERDDGGLYEILDPLANVELTLTSRGTSNVIDQAGNPVVGQVAYRGALATLAWEGLAVLPSGVVIYGDEERPGTGGPDQDGGAIFKFVPAVPRTGTGAISSLDQSPLTAGSNYAAQVSCQGNTQQYGQGCEIGLAAWVPVNAATARIDADAAGATGYYRPEDLHEDNGYSDPANPAAVRFCWANTGNLAASNYGEVVCGVDREPLTASSSSRTVTVNRFWDGDSDANSFDNLAFQDRTGNLYVIEDQVSGDVWACLPDGEDRDIKTDGCVKTLSVKDSSGEPTGFVFSPDGRTAYVSIQHSNDANMPLVDGYRTDDVLKITGFRPIRR